MNKMRKGDEVIVITGKDKGKTGKVISFSGDRVLVEGVNVVKKHVKANPQANEPGGVKDKTMPIHRSNIQVYDAAAKNGDTKGKGSRVGIRVLNDGQRVRYFKASDQVIKDEVVKE